MSQAAEVATPVASLSLVSRHDEAALRDALASFPSGVTIVTTTDSDGRWWGFTASSFCSVSMDPPLVLVCLATSAECHAAFAVAEEWVIQVIHPDHVEVAGRFATRGADKFGGGFQPGPHGLPVLDEAIVTLHCRSHQRHLAGDHTILVGEVLSAEADLAREPAVYFRRGFHRLP
ncbi:MAG TPA: flavin reductase family protein [Nocardioides sp.]|uniref:flavin reductase family protein n=1 Tax=uncultured Nocardioides sp. TaxID=198441 RepID=UPI000EDFE64F|nr:flavin reductase family protein [uncultured Nocardioides sp.]HCB05126.1 flavin reductase [Nocardioides sp.]HRD59817.1 flavin reductase family protein [Nocardioides sp.]HRI94159.1 flavin reductase family protein [Nocardioides sp.]HRK45287.1 flavin reductase family protein [Nocardioides sp.]